MTTKDIVGVKSKKYNDYQIIDVVNGTLNLESHTLAKYKLIVDNVLKESNSGNIKSVLDAGCSLGGIGLKIATIQGIDSVTLNNVTVPELDVAKEIAELCDIHNVEFSSDNIFNVGNSYDLTMYFALIHHLLRVQDIQGILGLIKDQTNLYTVMEIPVKGDALLDRIVKASQITDPWANRYSALASVDKLREHIEKVFDVLSVQKIEYGSGDLNRWAFICSVKTF